MPEMSESLIERKAGDLLIEAKNAKSCYYHRDLDLFMFEYTTEELSKEEYVEALKRKSSKSGWSYDGCVRGIIKLSRNFDINEDSEHRPDMAISYSYEVAYLLYLSELNNVSVFYAQVDSLQPRHTFFETEDGIWVMREAWPIFEERVEERRGALQGQ